MKKILLIFTILFFTIFLLFFIFKHNKDSLTHEIYNSKISEIKKLFNDENIIQYMGFYNTNTVEEKRVNIDYAEEYKDKLWRFYIKENPFVSVK